MKFSEQIRNNLLAIISLVVALSALGYNTWRNESSETNRNIRQAGFEIIKHIGELQKIAYTSHFDKKSITTDPKIAWTEVLIINDLSRLMPKSVHLKANELNSTWEKNWQGLKIQNEISLADIDIALLNLRMEVLNNMSRLK